MSNNIQEEVNNKIAQLKKFNFQIIIGNYTITFHNGETSFKVWSNTKQKDLILNFEDLNENFLWDSFNKTLEEYILFIDKMKEYNFSTTDFIHFSYTEPDTNNSIEFIDNTYTGLIKYALRDLFIIVDAIHRNEGQFIIELEKKFKKHCETKKFDIYDFAVMVKKEKSGFVQNKFAFKKDFNNKFAFGIDIEILEENNALNILIDKTKISLNLKNTDVVKNYPYKTPLTEQKIKDFIMQFKSLIDKDKKLQKYIEFFKENNFPAGSYIAKSYGFGVLHFYNPTFKQDVEAITDILKKNNPDIKYNNEFSDKEWIYRFKVNPKELEKNKIQKSTKKTIKNNKK